MRSDLAAQIPYEASELSGDGHAHLVGLHPPSAQAPIALTQAQLRTPGNRAHSCGLIFLAHLQDAADAGSEPIVPGSLHEHTACMPVAGLGNFPLSP